MERVSAPTSRQRQRQLRATRRQPGEGKHRQARLLPYRLVIYNANDRLAMQGRGGGGHTL